MLLFQFDCASVLPQPGWYVAGVVHLLSFPLCIQWHIKTTNALPYHFEIVRRTRPSTKRTSLTHTHTRARSNFDAGAKRILSILFTSSCYFSHLHFIYDCLSIYHTQHYTPDYAAYSSSYSEVMCRRKFYTRIFIMRLVCLKHST